MTATERFAINLSRRRLASRLTQEQLGALASLHRSEISLLERAGREPRLKTIVKLAAGLSIDPSALLRGIVWVPARTESGRLELDED
jgi:transcriptional regulator with XRE-family HTH domain